MCCDIHAVNLKEPKDQMNTQMADDTIDDVAEKGECLENLIQRERDLKDERDLEHSNFQGDIITPPVG